jgi:hypothetical protein
MAEIMYSSLLQHQIANILRKSTAFWDLTLCSLVGRTAVTISRRKKEKAKHGKNETDIETGRTRTLSKPIRATKSIIFQGHSEWEKS